jgi:hypothetical protein
MPGAGWLLARRGGDVISWVQNLPTGFLIVLVLVAMAIVTAAIYAGVMALAGSPHRPRLQISPGMLPPMAVVFALLVGFLVAQLWSNLADARTTVNQEASSLRSVVLLMHAFPRTSQATMDAFVREQIDAAATREWPAMAHRNATLTVVPKALAGALNLALSLKPATIGQQLAQREIVTSLQSALDARRQRIILSQSSVDWIRWTAVIALALLTLAGIGFVHSDNRRNAACAMSIFAAAAALTIVVIASEDRPFSGPFRVTPEVLLQVLPSQPQTSFVPTQVNANVQAKRQDG